MPKMHGDYRQGVGVQRCLRPARLAGHRQHLGEQQPYRKATTKLNDSYHNYPPYNTPAWRTFVTCGNRP
jgi:hypothetical protein